MSDQDRPAEPSQAEEQAGEEQGAERTRVRRRSPRGASTPVAEPAADAAEEGGRRSRSRRRPAVANPFTVEPTPTEPVEVVLAGGGTSADDPADGDGVVAEDEAASEVDAASQVDAAAEADVAAEVEVAAEAAGEAQAGDGGSDDEQPRKRRRRGGRGRRGRGRGGEGESGEGGTGDDGSDDGGPGDGRAAGRVADAAVEAREDAAEEDRVGADDVTAASDEVETAEEAAAGGDAAGGGADAAASADAAGGDGADGDDEDDDDARGSGRRRRRGRRGRGRRSGKAKGGEERSGEDQAAPAGSTRLSARSPRSGGGGGGGGRRRVPTVSPETRRVMAESPPKRMLVTVGGERTQIAVLEERTLVEHYVTQESEASYVGNIYKGRVQNVLPGMEAAFVDIGKGRNGVLYAGEVNYDEADRDGGLPRIEQALKPGQTVMVQVTKDPMGTKGARLTQHLSLAGRYCVLAPGDDMLGISRKLPDDQRERLRKILKTLKPEGFGLIVRTAAESATAEQLEADVQRLIERWAAVEEKAAKAKVLEPVYAEPQLVLRVIRDVFGPEHTQLIIDDASLAEQVKDYLAEVSPEHVDKVVVYEGDGKLFDAYEVTTQIRRALEKKVWLKSGGYLIVEKTEAMWVIDVNTGKFVGKDNLEETVLRNNIEAAEEIAKQLRLRDMGGIIVIDFVDMIVPANRDEVLKRFKRELARDKTKSRVMEISKLGLVQMTRKNVSKGLMEAFTVETDDVIPGRRIVEDLLA